MLISVDFYDFSIFYSFVFGATNFEFRSPIWRCFVGSVLRASHMKNSVCSHFALHQCELNETATKRRGSTGNPGRNRARSPELPCLDHSQTPSPLANETHQRDRPNWRTKPEVCTLGTSMRSYHRLRPRQEWRTKPEVCTVGTPAGMANETRGVHGWYINARLPQGRPRQEWRTKAEVCTLGTGAVLLRFWSKLRPRQEWRTKRSAVPLVALVAQV